MAMETIVIIIGIRNSIFIRKYNYVLVGLFCHVKKEMSNKIVISFIEFRSQVKCTIYYKEKYDKAQVQF